MRTIKFRTWHKTEKRMYGVNGLLWGRNGHQVLAEMFLVDETNTLRHVDGNETISSNYELMQFTGLKDHNGKEIYEGDIIVTANEQQEDWPVEEQYRGVVTYSDKGYFFIQQSSDYTPQLSNYTIISIEVIGNIYENPGLIEE